GIELAAQKSLAGVTGSRRVIKDRLGRVVEDIGAVREPHDGKGIALSIHSKIQYIAFTHLKEAVEKHQAKAGGAVVLDAETGEVLALVNLPTYNPNDRSVLTGAQLRNRVLTDTFEPGSVMKPFTIALALESRLATPFSLIETAPGRMTIGRATIGDVRSHGTLTVSQVLEKSSNIGTAKLALQMPPQRMWELLTDVGFGQAPRLGFPGAVAGRLRPHRSWKPIEQATISYGHGISTSLIQMAQSYLVFARDGEMIPLSLRKTAGNPAARRVLSRKTAQEVRAMMERATGPAGTAQRAQVPGYRVAGKTSTAHKVVNGRYANKYVAAFVGLAPVSDPRIIVAVMVDEPTAGGHFGGRVAAPVFAGITEHALRTLSVSPDSAVADIILPAEEESEET
ncbi:MAG: peptidoglycan D,D-transpeptidase FtsI family protein, partial [Noviherbaspirillum sp.]